MAAARRGLGDAIEPGIEEMELPGRSIRGRRASESIGDRLARAMAPTFARRRTKIPIETPDALTVAFAEDPLKVGQRAAFAKDIAERPISLAEVIDHLTSFLMPNPDKARELQSGGNE